MTYAYLFILLLFFNLVNVLPLKNVDKYILSLVYIIKICTKKKNKDQFKLKENARTRK